MTYEEVYKKLCQIETSDNVETINEALKAIDKQIKYEKEWVPVAPDWSGLTYTFICPVCRNYVYTHNTTKMCKYEYCPHCGQKILSTDITDEKDEDEDENI